MKNIITTFLLFFTFLSIAHSQEKKDTLGWHKSGFIAVNFSQAAFSNWAEGGENSIAGTGIFNFLAKYRGYKKYWDTNLDLAFGLLKSNDQGIRKNEDKIDLSSNYGKFAFGKFYYSAQLNFRTQFAPGYNYPNDTVEISKFMAPGFLTLAVGLNWKPNKYFSLFISPVTGKFTFVLDQKLADAGAFGVDSAIYDSNGNKIQNGKEIRPEFGVSLNAVLEKEIFKNILFATKLQLFNNYTDKNSDNRKNIDINWETGLLMKVNSFLSAAVSTQLIYDNDIPVPIYQTINGVKTQIGKGPRTQFKESLALSIGYKF
jgi:hypothetical protein